MSEKEKIYDEVIAPLLLEVMKKCQEAGIPFIAAVFYDEGSCGETSFIPVGCNNAYILTVLASVKARGNADSLIWWMMRHGKEHGHNSACLTIMENARR